ncbi:MotA/TolQ/ExbB proton channel family protein [Hyphomicrobium sulfonivorans]|uniref:Biopolymer transport protein ExbB n=1 Tax=Hyphomicrobium sulfonivorans TaxID=121290 RepID=A0A125NU86_HYPSL|nr:MotA/TolQ/ExbB proton channel family protein [Hyphomicrobium sulfonivorans]
MCLLACGFVGSAAIDTARAQESAPSYGAEAVQPVPAPEFVPVQDSPPAQALPNTSPSDTTAPSVAEPAGAAAAASETAAPPAAVPSFAAPSVTNEPATAQSPSSPPEANAESAGADTQTTPDSAQPGLSTAAGDGLGTVDGASQPADSASPAPASQTANNPALPHNLSPWGMFMAADIVVKAVMIGLAIASFATWTVWLAKAFELSVAKRRVRRTFKRLRTAASLGEALDFVRRTRGTGAYLVREAAEEMRASQALIDYGEGADGIKERVTSRLSRVEADAGRRLTRGTGLLATIGATAPFVGLFGTVWGIMNSFIGIAETKTTNLAVVAPGIAEALLATAIGLVAAIPAVIIYNNFARSIAGYRLQLANTSALIERLVSRDLDFNRMQREHQQAAATGYSSSSTTQANHTGAAPHATPGNLGAPVSGDGAGTAFAAE